VHKGGLGCARKRGLCLCFWCSLVEGSLGTGPGRWDGQMVADGYPRYTAEPRKGSGTHTQPQDEHSQSRESMVDSR